MAASQSHRTPAFFWQGASIVLPVIILAVVSLISLRQDERAAENDARERAATDAQNLSHAIRSSVDEELPRFLTLQNVWMLGLYEAGQADISSVFPDAKLQADIASWERDYPGLKFSELALPPASILADGRQIQPPEVPVAPQPPQWFRDLSPRQRELWAALRAAATPARMQSCRQAFRDSHPAAEADRAAGCLLQPPEQSAQNSGAVPSETGISFEEIACYRLLAATNAQLTDFLLQSLWWRVVEHPSMLSPKLLELAGRLTNNASPVLRQKYLWLQQYRAGQAGTAAAAMSLRLLPDLRSPKSRAWPHWTKDEAALALFNRTTFANPGADADGVSLAGEGYQVWLVPRPVLTAMFNRALAENRSLIPPYIAASLTVEDAPLIGASSTEGLPPVVAVELTAGKDAALGGIHVNLRFYLASRARMLAAERRRALLFGALVLAAALTAVAGLRSAHRAFRRQLQLNEQKSSFVSSVSHELRAPIAAVRLMAENLERGRISEPGKQREYFRFIVQECRRLSALIENVLDVARIEQGRKQYDFEPTDLRALVETTVKVMEPYAAEKGVALKCETAGLPSPAPRLELNVDGRALQQALVNLIDNAVKHSPKGESVTAGLATREAAVLLYVADHGPGIPAAEHTKIFERFYRLGSELRRETAGVGIGLSVVKHIVAAHGGRVWVDSAPGQGSRFTIELPPPSDPK